MAPPSRRPPRREKVDHVAASSSRMGPSSYRFRAMSPGMDDEARARLARFVIEKLSTDEDAFRADVARAIDGLLATPLEHVLDPARFEAAIDAALAKEQM